MRHRERGLQGTCDDVATAFRCQMGHGPAQHQDRDLLQRQRQLTLAKWYGSRGAWRGAPESGRLFGCSGHIAVDSGGLSRSQVFGTFDGSSTHEERTCSSSSLFTCRQTGLRSRDGDERNLAAIGGLGLFRALDVTRPLQDQHASARGPVGAGAFLHGAANGVVDNHTVSWQADVARKQSRFIVSCQINVDQPRRDLAPGYTAVT